MKTCLYIKGAMAISSMMGSAMIGGYFGGYTGSIIGILLGGVIDLLNFIV